MTTVRIVTVFGGTGFLGRRVVRRLRERTFPVRVASRHPDRTRELFPGNDPDLLAVTADIHDESSITGAIAGVRAILECISSFSGGSGNMVGISTLKEMGEPSTFLTVLKVDSFSAEAWHLRQYNPKPESG